MMQSVLADQADVDADLWLLETFLWFRKTLSERLCDASRSGDDDVLSVLRLEATGQVAEFLYMLKARRIETDADIVQLAEAHNDYIVALTRDTAKMARLGLKADRLLNAMFTGDTLPRLRENWREAPGTIDQSNLARLLVVVMSTETCRKILLACEAADFVTRTKTSYGTILMRSTGTIERIFAVTLREARVRMAGTGETSC